MSSRIAALSEERWNLFQARGHLGADEPEPFAKW